MYKAQSQYFTPLILLQPEYIKAGGVTKKTFPPIETGRIFYGTFKTYGGTERDINGIYSIEDTAEIETHFDPDIKSNSAIAIAGTNRIYEIIGEPENIEMRNKILKFKVKRIKGGA